MDIWIIRRKGEVVGVGRELVGFVEPLPHFRDRIGRPFFKFLWIVAAEIGSQLIQGLPRVNVKEGAFDVEQQMQNVMRSRLPFAERRPRLHLAAYGIHFRVKHWRREDYALLGNCKNKSF